MKKLVLAILVCLSLQVKSQMPSPKTKILVMSESMWESLDLRLPVFVKTPYAEQELLFDEVKVKLFNLTCINYYPLVVGEKCVIARHSWKLPKSLKKRQ